MDTLIECQAKIIDAAIQSQTAVNTANLRKRCQTYSRAPKLRQRIETTTDDHTGTTAPVSIANVIAIKRMPNPRIIAATKWMQSRNPASGELEYIKLLQSDVEIIDTIDEIDTNPYVLTTYQVNDYVLRRYPPTKIGTGNPHKYGSWWRGPYQITQVNNHSGGSIGDKTYYTIRNLVTDKEYVVDVTHMRPFYFDPHLSLIHI